jgi:acetyl esterase
VGTVSERTIPGPGGALRVRVYRPHGDGPFPLLVYFHGGGFVAMDLDTHDDACRRLCRGARCVVMSVEYRLAPEHPFPAATDDALAAVRWAADHTVLLDVDPRAIAVAGDSAGANLATVAALRIRDEGGPALCGQLLIYPGTDNPDPPKPSALTYATLPLLTYAEILWFFAHYCQDPGYAFHPHLAPLRAPDLRALPPALVLTAEFDALRDEGEQYAERLREAGVPVRLVRIEGLAHAMMTMQLPFREIRAIYREACTWLEERFQGEARPHAGEAASGHRPFTS